MGVEIRIWFWLGTMLLSSLILLINQLGDNFKSVNVFGYSGLIFSQIIFLTVRWLLW